MTTREKVVLAATGIVGAIALFTLVGGGKAPESVKEGAKPEARTAQVQTLSARMKEVLPGDFERTLLASVQEPWKAAAVYEKSLDGKQAVKEAAMHYTGYVELGSGRLAVVDGFEYQVGDDLEGGGYKVVAIGPDKVTLQSIDNGKQRDLPYQGQETVAQ